MPSWGEFAAADPEFARRVAERFQRRKHHTLATLRKDGSPRISGIEVQFEDGNVYVGMMPDSRKLNDLRRDPRLALHSATDDPPDDPAQWRGEAKLSGRAVEVSDPEKRLPAAGRFRIDIREVVLTHLNPRGDRLVVEAWHPSRGRNTLERE